MFWGQQNICKPPQGSVKVDFSQKGRKFYLFDGIDARDARPHVAAGSGGGRDCGGNSRSRGGGRGDHVPRGDCALALSVCHHVQLLPSDVWPQLP